MGDLDTSVIEWSVASRPRRGESESGDAYLVKFKPRGVLIAVVDGLGHGADAAQAARTALTTAGANFLKPLETIADLCHEALKNTRGAVMSLASIDARDDRLYWLGIGNVAGFVLSAGMESGCRALLMRSGMLGERLQHPSHVAETLAVGDVLIVLTDGIQWNPTGTPLPVEPPTTMARRLLREHAADNDDALVLIARYRGDG